MLPEVCSVPTHSYWARNFVATLCT